MYVNSVRMYILDSDPIDDVNRSALDICFLRKWKRAFSPFHSLPFESDVMFKSMGQHVEGLYPLEFVGLGREVIIHCHDSIDIIKDDVFQAEKAIHEFIEFCVRPHQLLHTLLEWHWFGVSFSLHIRDFHPYIIICLEPQRQVLSLNAITKRDAHQRQRPQMRTLKR